MYQVHKSRDLFNYPTLPEISHSARNAVLTDLMENGGLPRLRLISPKKEPTQYIWKKTLIGIFFFFHSERKKNTRFGRTT